MRTVTARIERNEDGHQTEIIIGNKKVTVNIEVEDGYIKEVVFKGREIPEIPEILKFLFEQNMINAVVANPAPVEVTIKSKSGHVREIIRNPSFEDDFAGWFKSGTTPVFAEYPQPVIDNVTECNAGGKSCRFDLIDPTKLAFIDQQFPIPIHPDWFTDLKFYGMCNELHGGAHPSFTTAYYDVDGGFHSQNYDVAAANTWELFTMTKPTKAMISLYFQGGVKKYSWIDLIFLEF